MKPKTDINVFYSWQSDLSRETNQRGIASCIKSSFIEIEDEFDTLNLIYDEATRGESGSPDIPSTILNKISVSDIFICDITTINNDDNSNRKVPNPNVLIELGYAISVLGWERIIMVFNKHFGDFQTQLPFDLEKRRVTQYGIKDKKDKSGKSDLTAKLKTAIISIINKNPKKPFAKSSKSSSSIKRERDIASLKSLMSCIHIPTFDYFVEELPNKVINRIFYFWYSYHGLLDSNSFHIYDKELKDRLIQLRNSWGKCLNFGHLFRTSTNGEDFVFVLPFDVFTDEKTEKDFKELTDESLNLEKLFKDFIEFVREKFLEIDIDELSDKAIKNYIDYKKENLDNLEK